MIFFVSLANQTVFDIILVFFLAYQKSFAINRNNIKKTLNFVTGLRLRNAINQKQKIRRQKFLS